MSPRGAESVALEVTGPQADELGVARRRVFGTQGGTIGRGPENDWVLADPYVSSRHASIEYRDGTFFIDDLNSRNGVFVNDQRVETGRPCALQNGDRVFIEPVRDGCLTGRSRSARRGDKQSCGLHGRGAPRSSESVGIGFRQPRRLVEPAGAAFREPAKAVSEDQDLDRGPLQEAVRPGVAKAPPPVSAPEIPPDYDPLADSPGQEPENPPASPIAAASYGAVERRRGDRRQGETVRPSDKAAGSVDLSAFLSGAGLEGVTISPEVAAQLGQILRVVVAGLLEVLKSRQDIKREFGIRHTVIERHGNNPLKFAVDVEDALHNLLVKKNPGYLGPVAAFEDAFVDVRHHQVAMLKGVGEAFEHILAHFHPDHLQQQEFDRHTPRRGGLQVLQGKPDYWERYREYVQRLASNQERSFSVLFVEKFARAYQLEFDRLKKAAPGEQPRQQRQGERER